MKCKECSEEIKFDFVSKTNAILRERELCFTCNYWLEHIERDKMRDNSFIIDGCHYSVLDEKDTGPFRGCAGRKFVIKAHDGREITTTNLWVQGDIPDRFRARMPDNAIFVKRG